jgi:hypothetical protein
MSIDTVSSYTNPMAATLLQIELLEPAVAGKDKIGTSSTFLRLCTTYTDRHAITFGRPGMQVDQSARVFTGLYPARDGEYDLELAAILNERLPGVADESEFVFQVGGTASIDRTFCVSNIMQIVRYQSGGVHRHAICPAIAVSVILEEHTSEVPPSAHIEFLPSVITAKYILRGLDAHDALSNDLEAAIDDFIGGINRIVAAHAITIQPDKWGILTPSYDRGSFPLIYMLIRGAGDAVEPGRIATGLLRAALVPTPYDSKDWQLLEERLVQEAPLDPSLRALRTAESYIQGGAYDLALLLLAIAVEVATARFVHEKLRAAGVPGKRLKDIEKDLTFSVMLNTQVMALAPDGHKPDLELIDAINRIRKWRNELMHKGAFALSRLEVVALSNAAEHYVTYLSSIGAA